MVRLNWRKWPSSTFRLEERERYLSLKNVLCTIWLSAGLFFFAVSSLFSLRLLFFPGLINDNKLYFLTTGSLTRFSSLKSMDRIFSLFFAKRWMERKHNGVIWNEMRLCDQRNECGISLRRQHMFFYWNAFFWSPTTTTANILKVR